MTHRRLLLSPTAAARRALSIGFLVLLLARITMAASLDSSLTIPRMLLSFGIPSSRAGAARGRKALAGSADTWRAATGVPTTASTGAHAAAGATAAAVSAAAVATAALDIPTSTRDVPARVRRKILEDARIAAQSQQQILSTGFSNVALNQPAYLSTTYSDVNPRLYGAHLAVDGNTNQQWYGGSCSHSGFGRKPWLSIDLGKTYEVDSIVVFNNLQYGNDVLALEVRVGDTPMDPTESAADPPTAAPPDPSSNAVCNLVTLNAQGQGTYTIKCTDGPRFGRWVSIQGIGSASGKDDESYAALCEVQVFGKSLVQSRRLRFR